MKNAQKKFFVPKKKPCRGLKKAFFDSRNSLWALPAYDFLKSDKNRSLLSCNHFYVSYDGFIYTQRFLGPSGSFFICIACMKNVQKKFYVPKKEPCRKKLAKPRVNFKCQKTPFSDLDKASFLARRIFSTHFSYMLCI